MTQVQREQLGVSRERAVLAGCLLPEAYGEPGDPHDPLAELRSLADTAGAVVVDEMLQKRQKPDPATFLGKGKIEELAGRVREHDARVVIFENDLSPSQIGNVEKIVQCKVLDRSELILDIFAGRARTHEAKLQVELAQLEYTYPRLRAMWSHLERIVGGAPAGIGTRGPGEQQLEIDRRIVQRKKAELKREIAKLQGRKTREVRARNQDFFTVGLVGYTNAGKSTLFNTLTDPSGGGGAYADDKLFATLSTRTRKWRLGSGDTVMVSDTVGFVRNLPHHLVASFRATLEEAIHADLLLIVVDVSHPRARQNLDTVMGVLEEIDEGRGARGEGQGEQGKEGSRDRGIKAGNVDPFTPRPSLLVLNKIDQLEHNADLLVFQREFPDAIPISARTGRGVADLVERVRQIMRGGVEELTVSVDAADGKTIHFLENRANVLDRRYEDRRVDMTVRIGRRQPDQLRAMGGSARLPEAYAAVRTNGWGT